MEDSNYLVTTNFSQADLGDNPSVNLATGRLRYAFSDLSIGHGNFAIDVSHIYLSKTCSDVTNVFSEFGKKWKLNLSQYVAQDGSNFLYLDAMGEVHRFVKFDTTRYYDDRNAKLVLETNSNGYIITDGVGNKLYFNSNGYIIRSVSCHNSAMRKEFVYEGNKLVSVYDLRSVKNGVVQSRIALTYNANGLLSTMTAYVNNGRVLGKLKYEYDSSSNLVAVSKICVGDTGDEILRKRIWAMSYQGSLLSVLENCETSEALRITYQEGMIKKIEHGVITQSANVLPLGAKDAAGNPLALGMTNCGCEVLGAEKSFESKNKYNSYNYCNIQQGIATETDVTNECGITLAYFIDRNACITSSFEKIGSELKTLNKQGAKRTNKFGENLNNKINGNYNFAFNKALTASFVEVFEISRNNAEKNYKNFNYSFWLKTSQIHDVMEARLTCGFSGYDTWTSTVYINPKAQNAWQKVTLPVTVPVDNDDKPVIDVLQSLKIELLADKSNTSCNDSYEINEIGFEPATHSEMQLACLDGFFPLQSVDHVDYTGESEVLSKNLYFTESDIVATFTNKFKALAEKYGAQALDLVYVSADFDIICNNGTRRIKSNQIWFGEGANKWTNPSDTPFKIITNSPVGKTIETVYIYNSRLDDSTITPGIYVLAQTENDNGRMMSTMSVTDYYGNIIYNRDEYNVSTKYDYDVSGNLVKTQIIASDGTVGETANYFYDDEGRLTKSYNSRSGQQITYDQYDQVSKVTESQGSGNNFVLTPHAIENTYGVYRNNATQVTESDGTAVIGQNKVTYQNGRIRTVTDGVAKYGVKHNIADNAVEYTRFNGNYEDTLQKDSITIDDDNQQIHTSEFVNGGNISSTVDKYGRIKQVKRSLNGVTETFNYTYDENITESIFASKPQQITKGNNKIHNVYDDDGNLTTTGLYEAVSADNNGTNYKWVNTMQQIDDNTVKYQFENDAYEYYSSIQYDADKAFSPRVTAAKNMWYCGMITDYEVQERPIFCQDYAYDKFGRLTSAKCDKHYNYEYEYATGDNGSANLLQKVKYRNTTVLEPELNRTEHLDIKQDENLTYYPNGLVKSVNQTYSFDLPLYTNVSRQGSGAVSREYAYDSAHRLTQDICTQTNDDGSGKKTTQNYSYRRDGRLQSLAKTINHSYADGTTGKVESTTTYFYNKFGQLLSLTDGTTFSYDGYGNRVQRNHTGDDVSYEYKYGSMLTKVVRRGVTSNYNYNLDGVRCKKTVGSVETKYYLDGNKILRENGKNDLHYYYGKDGLIGFALTKNNVSKEFVYVYDSQGNVTMVFSKNNPSESFARYEYDAFGNCTVRDSNGAVNNSPDFIGNINPFRWKGFYFDEESGLYYANGSYYDPETGLYVDAAPMSTVIDNAFNTRSLDRNRPVCNNILELACNPSTIFNEVDLHADPTYDPESKLPDWLQRRHQRYSKYAEWLQWYNDLHWGWKLGLGIAFLLGAVAFTLASGGGALGVLSMLAQVAIGVGVGIAMYSLGALFGLNEFSLEGLGNAALDSFLASSAIAFVSSGVSYIKSISRSGNISTSELKECVNQCFIAGTLIQCEDGFKKIEDIQVGDKVLAYNEETGEQDYKTVLHIFRNESKDWVGITVKDKEIVSTPGHKYYLPLTKQWVSAKDLKVGDNVLLSNGQLDNVQKTRSIHYDTPQTTYNFEVEDFHTYYVETGVLVHNQNCGFNDNQKALIELAKESKDGVTREQGKILVDWAKEYGINNHGPMIHVGRQGIWSQTEHIKIFKYHIKIID